MATSSLFTRWPMLRTMIPSSLALGAGDALCQKLEHRDKWDPERSSRMAITGFFLVSPVMYHIFRGLDRMFPGVSSGAVACKSVINSLCTVLYISGSFTGNAVLAGQGVNHLMTKLDDRLMRTWLVAIPYWCVGSALVFRFGTVMTRGLLNSATALSWNTYLSYQINRKSSRPPQRARPLPLPVQPHYQLLAVSSSKHLR